MLCDIISNLNIDKIFKNYGDYTYIFNEHEFDYNIDKDWTWKLDNTKKCTKIIPGIEHKICAETENYKVSARIVCLWFESVNGKPPIVRNTEIPEIL